MANIRTTYNLLSNEGDFIQPDTRNVLVSFQDPNDFETYNTRSLVVNFNIPTPNVPEEIIFNFKGSPDWRESLSEIIFNLKEETPQPPNVCYPDFYQLLGNNVSFSIDSCDGYPDFGIYNGTVNIDLNCCPIGNICRPDRITINGDNALFDFKSASGNPDRITINGDSAIFDFDCIFEDQDFVCYPDFRSAYGLEANVDFISKSSFPDFLSTHGLNVVVDFDCFDEQASQGELVLVSGDIWAGNFEIESEVIVSDVPPTLNGRIVLDATMEGSANFRRRFFVEGDIKLDDLVMSNSTAEFEQKNTVYYANIRLDCQIEGYVDFIEGFVGDITLDDLQIEGKVIAPNVVLDSEIGMGDFIFNRGWIHHGDPDAPLAREFYEATGIESMEEVWHPVDAKYAIFVPTMSYNIRNIEQRHGTLVYSLDLSTDAIDVETVKVWLMDEGGNAVRDTIAKFLNGEKLNHDLENPFRYSLTIPIHCINERKYHFYLEVIYRNKHYLLGADDQTKSHFVKFNPEYKDNRDYINLNDRITLNSSTFDTQKPNFVSDYIEQASIYETFTDNAFAYSTDAHGHGGFTSGSVEFTTTYENFVDIINVNGCSHSNIYNQFAQTYFELDVGQIGG